jgi:hypothetical protein
MEWPTIAHAKLSKMTIFDGLQPMQNAQKCAKKDDFRWTIGHVKRSKMRQKRRFSMDYSPCKMLKKDDF